MCVRERAKEGERERRGRGEERGEMVKVRVQCLHTVLYVSNTVRRDRLRVFVCDVQRGKTARKLNRKGCQTGEMTDGVKEGGGRTAEAKRRRRRRKRRRGGGCEWVLVGRRAKRGSKLKGEEMGVRCPGEKEKKTV